MRRRRASKPDPKTQAVIYCRVSTLEQLDNFSLQTQEAACRRLCEQHSFQVAAVFQEAESAKTVARAQFEAMQDYCLAHRKTVGAVVVHSVSRFSRVTSDHFMVKAILRKLGIQLLSATEPIGDSVFGEAMEGIVSVLAQLDNRMKADRTKEGMRAGANSGKWMHKAPLGYRTVPGSAGGIEIDTSRSTHIRNAFELLDGGKHTKTEILRVVSQLGLTTEKGKPLSAQALDNILRNPIYAGTIDEPSLGVVARGKFEPTISRDLFERTQRRHAGMGEPQERQRRNPEFPLSVFVRCYKCGSGLTGSFSKGRLGNKYPYYFCRKKTCRAVKFRRDDLHAAFLDLLASYRMESGSKSLFREVVREVWRQKNSRKQDTLTQCRKRIAEMEESRQEIFDLFLKRKIDEQTFKKQTERIDGMLNGAKELETESLIALAELDRLLDFAEWMTWRAESVWFEAPIADRDRIQKAFFPEGVVAFEKRLGTPPTASFLMEFRSPGAEISNMASPEGVEPSLPP